MARTEEPDRLLSAREAGKRLGVSSSTVRAMVKRGVLHKIMLSTRCARFRESDVQRLVERGVSR